MREPETAQDVTETPSLPQPRPRRYEPPAGDHSDPEYQYRLGLDYLGLDHSGFNPDDHVDRDLERGIRWLRLAAEQGHPDAQIRLGGAFYTGEGVPRNYEESHRWYRAAADQGHPYAQWKVGEAYHWGGRGVPQDYEEAVRWFLLAADQGHRDAQYRLGYAYSKGLGVPQDHEEAARWWRLYDENESEASLGPAAF